MAETDFEKNFWVSHLYEFDDVFAVTAFISKGEKGIDVLLERLQHSKHSCVFLENFLRERFSLRNND